MTALVFVVGMVAGGALVRWLIRPSDQAPMKLTDFPPGETELDWWD